MYYSAVYVLHVYHVLFHVLFHHVLFRSAVDTEKVELHVTTYSRMY